MAALQDLLDEQARIKQELQRMENDDTVTEESDGDLRDTLLQRWEELDAKSKPLIERMEKIRAITRTAEDPANTETPYGQRGGIVSRSGGTGPELVTRNRTDPFDPEAVSRARQGLLSRSELRERAIDAIEVVAKRQLVDHDGAEEVSRKVFDGGYYPGNNIARHILETGTPEYYEAFENYVRNPDDMVARAALNLGNASGGFLLPYVLDQLQVA